MGYKGTIRAWPPASAALDSKYRMIVAHDPISPSSSHSGVRRALRGGSTRSRASRWGQALVLLIALGLEARPARAALLDLPDTSYSYTVIDQDLAAALQEFGSNLNVKMNVSPEVRGRIQGRLPQLSPRGYLDRLSALYNLEWYFDGLVLHVTSVREAQSRLLVLSPLSFDHLRYTLDALGISDSRYVVRPAPGNGIALVAGPPRFVSLVEQTLAGLIAEDQARPRVMVGPRSAPAPASVLPRDTLLTVFRGAETTIIRNGRPERFGGPDEQRRTARNSDQQSRLPDSAQ